MRNRSRSILPRLARLSLRFLSRSRVLREESGNGLVELALLMSLFGAPLLVGTVELGLLVYDSIEVSNAAHAGAMYGMTSSTFAGDTAGMTSAAQAEASDFGSSMTVTPTVYFACSSAVSGTQYSTETAATSACSGAGDHPLEFVQVLTSQAVTPIFHFPGFPATITLTGASVMMVEE